MEVCKEELCESNEIHEDLLKIVDETLPEESSLCRSEKQTCKQGGGYDTEKEKNQSCSKPMPKWCLRGLMERTQRGIDSTRI